MDEEVRSLSLCLSVSLSVSRSLCLSVCLSVSLSLDGTESEEEEEVPEEEEEDSEDEQEDRTPRKRRKSNYQVYLRRIMKNIQASPDESRQDTFRSRNEVASQVCTNVRGCACRLCLDAWQLSPLL